MNNTTAGARLRHFALTGLLLTVAGVAQASPVLQLTTTSGLQAGSVKDGTVLMRGRVSSDDPHGGFRLWCVAHAAGSSSARCVLTGQRHTGNTLRVRLSGEGWYPGPGPEGGMMTVNAERSVVFLIEADGDQDAAADTWAVALSAATTD
ncbi:AfaD family invasin [Pantoea stewartii]|uniref:AfaD family invasin n=1 Tax=Pantoea stewartii TaxID=66269 RepID=UPI0023F94E49|nr:AfaD family invasin [Pantoea stewartii]MDF7788613.1 AfaD family invasin [Pantoea stewartii]